LKAKKRESVVIHGGSFHQSLCRDMDIKAQNIEIMQGINKDEALG
jgi:hypothetical protein